MRIDLHHSPEKDIFRDKQKYTLWFLFFILMACVAVSAGCYLVYSDGSYIQDLENYALGLLVISSIGVTRFGNRLQQYKKLFPPQMEKLALLRKQYGEVEKYCAGVEVLQRRFIRAEYEACIDYAERCEAMDEQKGSTEPVVYGPAEFPKKSVVDESEKK